MGSTLTTEGDYSTRSGMTTEGSSTRSTATEGSSSTRRQSSMTEGTSGVKVTISLSAWFTDCYDNAMVSLVVLDKKASRTDTCINYSKVCIIRISYHDSMPLFSQFSMGAY